MSSEEPGCESERVTTEEMSTLSVIIPILKEERYVGALLSDLAAQTRKPVEIIVVDVGSTDRTAAVVRRFPFARLLEGTLPVACGKPRRPGATGEVLTFLDADVRLSVQLGEPHRLRVWQARTMSEGGMLAAATNRTQ